MKKLIIIMVICLSSFVFGSDFIGSKGAMMNNKDQISITGNETNKMMTISFNDFITKFGEVTLIIEDDNGDIHEFDKMRAMDKNIMIFQSRNRSNFAKIIKLFKKSKELKLFVKNEFGLEYNIKINCQGFTKVYNKL